MTQPLNVLIACEHTGAVRDAFNAMGHAAVSNDLLPEPHEPHEAMSTSNKPFTPPIGVSFMFQEVMGMRVVAYEGEAIICSGINGWDDHHTYRVVAEDRNEPNHFRVIEEKQ